MSNADRRRRPARKTQLETLEDRVVMSADPLGGLLGGAISHHGLIDDGPGPVVQHGAMQDAPPVSHHGVLDDLPPLSHQTEAMPDFWLGDTSNQIDVLEGSLGEVEQTLSSAHSRTGLNNVRTDYGFRGGGQTVAVIDSGIAYDHYALGGGFGSNYRVVGGWDFTGENDADPYDDGPEGSHGTHVAGIIGSSHDTHQGVAPDVDLVGLRVFDDVGNGYFSWVENALNWVHANRNAFENPITAVNLSLGTNWNSASIPSWANLEDEFAQLEADGIFISVSAGNSFTSYNTPGLSYPAASPYVVPVMSMDDSGVLSYFSQRHQTAIAAPGRWIYSTIPDYAGNNNGVTDDWANFSGTSMAAPYVAGASVIVREAMEFVGMTNIDQDTIYSHMLATADSIYDSATGLSYARLNVEAAIDALMPTDDYGSDLASAYSLGSISGSLSTASLMDMNGVISTLDDSDYFTFTAATTGTVTFTASNTTHDFDASWQAFGGQGAVDASGNVFTVDVIAGQQYSVALSSEDGLGYYDLGVTAEATFTYTDWGTLTGQQTQANLTAGSPAWYRIVAGQDGYLTAEAIVTGGSADIALYDSGQNLIANGNTSDRLDHYTTAGTEFYLRVEGSSSDVDVRLTNLVSVAGNAVTVMGTNDNDILTFTAGSSSHTVAVNEVDYTFASSTYDTFELDGGAGTDVVTLVGTAGNENAWLSAASARLEGSGFTVEATGFTDATVQSGGGSDVARVYDSAGNDNYYAWADRVSMNLGSGVALQAEGFSQTLAYATSGLDVARMYDSSGDDVLRAYEHLSTLEGDGFYNYARGFDQVWAYATMGNDRAQFYDSAGSDTFRGYHDKATMTGTGYWNYAKDFDTNIAFSTSNDDIARFYDSSGDDLFYGYADRAILTGAGFNNTTYGFDNTTAYSSSGNDIARLYDSAGDDLLYAYHDRAVLSGFGFSNEARAFSQVWAYASDGEDIARLYDSAGDDVLRAYHDKAMLSGDGFYNYARAFEQTWSYASTGDDIARIYGTAGNDVLRVYHDKAMIAGSLTFNYVRAFKQTFADGGGGSDTALLYDSPGDDTLTAADSVAQIANDNFAYSVDDFETVTANRSTGTDVSTVEATDFVFQELGGWA